jgi:hypothetical protein
VIESVRYLEERASFQADINSATVGEMVTESSYISDTMAATLGPETDSRHLLPNISHPSIPEAVC